jgi:hypothetical protein
VDRKAAEELAGAWLRAQSERYDEVVDYYQWMAQEIAALCSHHAEGGVAEVNGTWAVIAHDGEILLSFSVPEADLAEEGRIKIRCQTVSLRGPVEISLNESIQPKVHGLVRRRDWSFRPSGSEPMVVSTEQLLQAAFRSDEKPSGAELAVRNAAPAGGLADP